MQRLFFSLKFSGQQQLALLPYQQQALRLCANARAVDADNLHLTLFFLGNVAPRQQQRLSDAAAQIAIPAFSLTLEKLAGFSGPKILYLAPTVIPAPLQQLQQQLAQRCKAEGFNDIYDNYRPHITLARHALCSELSPIAMAPLTLNVVEFALFHSSRQNGRLCYQPLNTFTLA
jgi:RNA 2',3'-cyclic 3'-phosphodiesterase